MVLPLTPFLVSTKFPVFYQVDSFNVQHGTFLDSKEVCQQSKDFAKTYTTEVATVNKHTTSWDFLDYLSNLGLKVRLMLKSCLQSRDFSPK